MVGDGDDSHRFAWEGAQEAVRTSEGREHPERCILQRIEAVEIGRDRHHCVRRVEERASRRAEVAAAPRRAGVHREEAHRRAYGARLQRTVDDEGTSAGGGEVDGGLTRLGHDRLHAPRADERFVSHVFEPVAGRDEARPPRPTTIRMPDEHRPEMLGHGQREPGLAGATERRPAHRDDGQIRKAKGPRDGARQPRRGRHGQVLDSPRKGHFDPVEHARTLLCSSMTTKSALDPVVLANRQIELDTERTKRFPELLIRKYQRMSASPLAYLRGAAPVFYEILRARPDLLDGPGGEGWIVGDMHLENFGAYRPDPLGASDAAPPSTKKSRIAVFDLNDFDETVIGPWRVDVLRLTTSLLLGGRELGANGIVALHLVDRLIGAWARAVTGDEKMPEAPAPVAALIEQVRSREKNALLDARTKLVGHTRRFVRGPRYSDLPKKITDDVPKAFEAYIASLPEEDKPHKGSLEIIDCALRIAGTGSLGGLRVAVLVKGKGGPDGAWIFDMKEQGAPSCLPIIPAMKMEEAARVAEGFRRSVERPPRMIGTATLGGLSMFCRKLSPQEDKLNLRRLARPDLKGLATYLGALLGKAHLRAQTKPKKWNDGDIAQLRTQAIAMAGIHEAVYLELCDKIRDQLPEPA